MNFCLVTLLIAGFIAFASAGTSISVTNGYKKEINVKIGGAGVGGCDVILQPGQSDTSDCWCLWGTLNYAFCVYNKSPAGEAALPPSNSTVAQGRCPIITGESLLCSDIASLGNCYGKSYSCSVDATGLCHCE